MKLKLLITNTRCLPSKVTQYKTYRPGYELEVTYEGREEIDWDGLRALMENQLDKYETLIFAEENAYLEEKEREKQQAQINGKTNSNIITSKIN